MLGKEKFLKAMKVGCCKRFCMKYCKGQGEMIDYKYLGNRWPEVHQAPDPSLILWQNLGFGVIDRCLYSCYVILATLFLLLLGFSLIVYLILYKDSYT